MTVLDQAQLRRARIDTRSGSLEVEKILTGILKSDVHQPTNYSKQMPLFSRKYLNPIYLTIISKCPFCMNRAKGKIFFTAHFA